MSESQQNGALAEIVGDCLKMDAEARDVYARFAQTCPDRRLGMFWKRMSDIESRHVRFWQGLRQLAEDRMLPMLIEEPERSLSELRKLRERTKEVRERCEAQPDLNNMFLLAYRIEFSLLHPAVAKLFHFMSTTGTGDSPEDAYQSHLADLTTMVNESGGKTIELTLLGEAVDRLWSENRRLARQSFEDDLTGVLNRRGFFNAIRPLSHLAHRNRHHVAIFMIDIDDFKRVNDTWGHSHGDHVLTTVAGLIRGRMRASDIVGRYGGEEFIVFLPEVNRQSVARISDDLRSRVQAGFSSAPPVTVSVGAATARFLGNVDRELQSLIDKADDCLGTAKRGGKNRVEVTEV